MRVREMLQTYQDLHEILDAVFGNNTNDATNNNNSTSEMTNLSVADSFWQEAKREVAAEQQRQEQEHLLLHVQQAEKLHEAQAEWAHLEAEQVAAEMARRE